MEISSSEMIWHLCSIRLPSNASAKLNADPSILPFLMGDWAD
jgi:hypothetical protein